MGRESKVSVAWQKLQQQPESITSLQNRVYFLLQHRETTVAKQLIKKILVLEPQSFEPKILKALVTYQQGQDKQALNQAQKSRK